MTQTIECPKCGEEANAWGRVSCWCDKDFCTGQRCGADDLAEQFECKACGASGTTPKAERYYAIHTPKD